MSTEYKILRWIGAVILPLPGVFVAFFLTKIALSTFFGIDDTGVLASGIESLTFGILFSMLVWKLAPENEYPFTKWYDIVVGFLCVALAICRITQSEQFPIRDTVMSALWVVGMIGGIAMKKSGE